jgi:hypothetical protein
MDALLTVLIPAVIVIAWTAFEDYIEGEME